MPSQLQSFERVGYDEMLRSFEDDGPPPEVIVIDIDEASLLSLGQWPWPRYRIAALIDEAASLGARTIVLDFLFPEADRLSLTQVEKLYLDELDVRVEIGHIPAEKRDNDLILARSIEKHGVVMSAELILENTTTDLATQCGETVDVVVRSTGGVEGAPPVPSVAGMRCPIPVLTKAAAMVASANTNPDRDGLQRRLPLLLRSGTSWVPGLALATVLRARDLQQVTITWGKIGVESVRVGETTIPTDPQGNMLLPYRGRPTDRFTHISAADLLAGKIERSMIENKIVLFGTSAGGLEDLHATPVMRLCPGVDLHALAIDGMLRQDFFVEPGWSLGIQALSVIFAGIIVTGLVTWASIWLSTVCTAIALVGFTAGPWYALSNFGLYWSPLPGLVTLLIGFTLLALVRLRYEERRKEQVRQSFKRYVSAPLVDEIMKSPETVKLSGERRSISILMSDIRGFTALSETMDAEDLVQFLNTYFAAMIDIIMENGGTLDKFMGDAILALFGAPFKRKDDVLKAVRVADSMQKKLKELNTRWEEEGLPSLKIGIGVSTGDVVVGNIGSNRRLEYTAIGPAVNYAQRIESLTKELGAEILISQETYESIREHVEVKRHGPLTIKGKHDAIYVYEVINFFGFSGQ
jgi:adenylate cyclase